MNVVTSPAVNGFYACGFNVTGSAALDPTCSLQGIGVTAESGNYSLLFSDRLAYVKESGTTTSTLTLGQITSNFAANYAFVTQNLNSGNETLQTNAADKIDGGSTGGTQTILPKWAAWVYSDSSSAPGNWWTAIVPTFAAFGSNCGDGTHALNWSTTAGIGCQTLTGGGGGTTNTIANGTAALGTSAISSGTCATVVTVTATGVATTDNVMGDFNADPTSTTGYAPSSNGMLTIIKYPTSGNVNFKVCNNTAASITPGAVTLNWRVVR
jgi:hypothetical protein